MPFSLSPYDVREVVFREGKSHESIAHSWHQRLPLFQKWRGKGPRYVCGTAMLFLRGILFMFGWREVVGRSAAALRGCW